ncbi:MAG: hypothetical protein ACRDZQ_15160, partial [Acidimicrobiales bacterium]
MLIKPSRQAPAQPWRPRSMEGAALYRMWRMCAWTFNHTLRRRPYKTVWAIVALGLAGSHAWPLFAVAIGAPLVVIGLYRHGPRLGVMDRWAV